MCLKMFIIKFGKKWSIRVEKVAIRMYVYPTCYDFQYLFLSTLGIIQGPMCCPTTPHPLHHLIPSLFILSMVSVFLVPCSFRGNCCLISRGCCFSVGTCAVLNCTFLSTASNTNIHGRWVSNVKSYIPMRKLVRQRRKTKMV